MAQNPPPATQQEEQVILVRGSEEHQSYLKHQFGRIKGWVNAFETRIAVAGRALLLIYVVYITVKAGAGVVHIEMPPQATGVVNVVLFLLDIFMLALQVLGLEGSVPGLVHLADEMENQRKHREAERIRSAADTAQFLMAATAIDVVLQYMPHVYTIPGHGPIDVTWFAFAFDKILFIVRVIVIGRYLKAMARLENKGPKIISQAEYDRQQHEAEQEEIRIDNTNILGVVTQAITDWATSQPDMNASFSDSIKYLESMMTQKINSFESAQNERIAALSRRVESAQFGSTSTGSVDSEALALQIEAALSRSNAELKQSFEARISEVSRQVSRVEASTANQMSSLQEKNAQALAEAEARYSEALKKTMTQVHAETLKVKAVREPAKTAQAKITNLTQAMEEKQNELTVEEVKNRIEAEPSLLKLSGSELAQKVGTSKATANRAKSKYLAAHPEATQNSDSGEREAINL